MIQQSACCLHELLRRHASADVMQAQGEASQLGCEPTTCASRLATGDDRKRKEKLTQCMPGIAGTKQPSTAAPETAKSHQNVDNAIPASQPMAAGASTPPTQVALLSRQQYDLSAQDLICGLTSGKAV